MDRTIPKNIRLKASIKRWVPAAVVAAAVIIGIIWLMFWLREGVREQDLDLRTADIGEIRSAITTNGKIIPAFEEIIVSPVNTRILEVYVHEGDSVAAGSPLLRLDIEDARNHYQRMADELQMKQSEIHSQSLSDETLLTDLEMKIKTKELAVDQLKEEYNSEQRLDSIGSGTGERVRQARLAWQTATLELQQMRRQLANERRIRSAMAQSKRLEGDISRRNLAEASRTLDEARLCAPRSGTITFLTDRIGATVAAGEQLAILSDLSNFRVTGELPEGHADKLSVGAPVEVRSGNKTFLGTVSHMTGQSKSGVIPFSVRLETPDAPGLRAGMNARIGVIYDIKPDVVRIPYATFFNGPGEYDLYVLTTDNRLERRRVRLGDSNLDYIEVVSGIKAGEKVNLNDMKSHAEVLRIQRK